MYAQVETAWNFLNPWGHDQDQLLSHGEARPQQWHSTRHHLQLSVRRMQDLGQWFGRLRQQNMDNVWTSGIRCGGRRSTVILAETRSDDEDCQQSVTWCASFSDIAEPVLSGLGEPLTVIDVEQSDTSRGWLTLGHNSHNVVTQADRKLTKKEGKHDRNHTPNGMDKPPPKSSH